MSSTKAISQFVRLEADSQGNPPIRIHLMGVGHWHAPWHGNFEMTPEDLAEMVTNFDDGVGLVQGSQKLPINYGHDISGKAAGWITKLTVENNGKELWGDVEWTPEGNRMLQDGEFKYISPEWNPRSFPYQDPEDEDTWINNVFTGAGLTNIPLFKKLKPIMASLVAPKKKLASVVPGEGDKPKGELPMDLAQLRAKKLDELSADEKAFVTDHKAELTADELKTFELEETPAPAAAPAAPVTPEAPSAPETPAAPETPVVPGNVEASTAPTGLTASQQREWDEMKVAAEAGLQASRELAETKANGFIASAIAKGQIKTGDSAKWTKVLLASSKTQRTELENLITGLPVNASIGRENGDSGTEDAHGASDELEAKTIASIKASADKGKKVSFAAARKEILKADPALAARVKEESKEN